MYFEKTIKSLLQAANRYTSIYTRTYIFIYVRIYILIHKYLNHCCHTSSHLITFHRVAALTVCRQRTVFNSVCRANSISTRMDPNHVRISDACASVFCNCATVVSFCNLAQRNDSPNGSPKE